MLHPRNSLRAALLMMCLLAGACAAADTLTPEAADNSLSIAERMLEGGAYDRAAELAAEVLDNPAAEGREGTTAERLVWLVRRERARFYYDRGMYGLARGHAALIDVAASLTLLANNRYRLPEPMYNVQAAYWAGRAYEDAAEYADAVRMYERVGGILLPDGMEGDAAQRMSRCLRHLAEKLPWPGDMRVRQERDSLLTRAITELDRARLAFPVGNRRKEIELDRIALRMARRDEQYVREAATEAEAFIEADPAKDEVRARAALYRGNATALLGQPEEAQRWFLRVLEEEAPSDEDRRQAALGLALAQVELAETQGADERVHLLARAVQSLDSALEGTTSPGPWDGARVAKARIQLELRHPNSAIETLRPLLDEVTDHGAWQTAGLAELARGRFAEAMAFLYPATRPSNDVARMRLDACRAASRTAASHGDYGMALALNHHASRLLRARRLFPTLLQNEFAAMELLLSLGRMGGPVSLEDDVVLAVSRDDDTPLTADDRRQAAADKLAAALGGLLTAPGPDSSYDAAASAEALYTWSGKDTDILQLVIGMIAHLRDRRPPGVDDNTLSSRLGQARQALAQSRAEQVLAADEPDLEEIERIMADFAAAADNYQDASAGGMSVRDTLEQGTVNMKSGEFLMRLARRWNTGRWTARAMAWRGDARLRIESSLTPFNQTINTSGGSASAARRARWSRGTAQELMGEYRGAASDFLVLMNNSELPRVLRVNAARHWALCLAAIGDQRQALTRLSVFADSDAEAALIAGRLAEDSGDIREAYQRYMYAARPDALALPPATPARMQQAAYNAARLALADPREVDPLLPAEEVVAYARQFLQTAALTNIDGEWPIRMLMLLGQNWIADGGSGWQNARQLAARVITLPNAGLPLVRAMYILSARAFVAGARYDDALGMLDEARDRLDGTELSRPDAAVITLETARVFRLQGRDDDALRAFADVFAVYPEQTQCSESAREEAAVMILSNPASDPQRREQAGQILSGLQNRMLAERLMREYGIR